jgi:hypothetical protein
VLVLQRCRVSECRVWMKRDELREQSAGDGG